MLRRVGMTDVDGAKGDVYLFEFFGNSSDLPPTENVSTGSVFVEIDSGAVYFFDEGPGRWINFATGEDRVENVDLDNNEGSGRDDLHIS